MNILQALFFPPEQPGGVSSMVPYIQNQFVKKGWEMELLYLPKRLRGKGTEAVRMASFSTEPYEDATVINKYLQTYRDYLWWIDLRIKKKYDLIHAHHPIAALAMKQRFPDTPVLITVHSSYEQELMLNGRIQENGPEARFLTSLYHELEERLEMVLTVSQSFKQYLSRYMERPEQIIVIPNGFDEKRFRPVDHVNAVAQFITVCRLIPAKGLDTLLKACAALKARGHQFVLHLIGDGPIRKDLEEQAEQLGIYHDVIFYGYMLHPEEFMPFSDVFVLPSRAESFGSVFAEAALCGLALVGTEIGGIREQIENGQNGLLAPVDDEVALADAMERLIEDPVYRQRMSEAAKEKAKKTYSLRRVIGELKIIYESYRKE